MYPDTARPYNGIFIAEQLNAIKDMHKDVDFDVCYIEGENKGKTEYIKSIARVNSMICHNNYDLVHIHFGLSGLYLLWPFRKRIPTIVTFHGSDIQPAGGNNILTIGISRLVARIADTCITLNSNMDKMVRRYNSNTFIIPCAVDTKIFHPTSHKHSHCGTRKIVFPCNHDMKVKNYNLFRQTLDIIRQEYNINCEECELSCLSRQQVATLFNDADLMIMTSRSEGSPQAVKEALACNLPVVSTPVGDVEELLHNVKNCFVANTHNAKELAKLAVMSLSHSSQSGMTGWEKIMDLQLNEQSVADKIYSIYEQSIH